MIKIKDISHVVFQAPDLDRMSNFLTDFGLSTAFIDGVLYARGVGDAPYLHVTELGDPGFVSLGLQAESIEDVQALGQCEGIQPRPVNRPGGGLSVTMQDPDGFLIEVIAGQAPLTPLPLPERVAVNCVHERLRVQRPKRTASQAAHVIRLGHCVLNVSNFHRSEEWYKRHFGLVTSDEIETSPGVSIGAFLRCDRGEALTDHHTLFVLQSRDGVAFNHAAFEVVDFEDLQAGHQRLSDRGWTPVWGVGRHVLGSQVFDYWNDPWGHKLEHWTDGDLFTLADGSNKVPLPELLAVQWGPAPPHSH